MESAQSLSITWKDMAAACSIMAFLLSLATGYLRLFISKSLIDMRDKLTIEMKTNFVFKETYLGEQHNLKKEVTRNEAQITKLIDRVNELEMEIHKRKTTSL